MSADDDLRRRLEGLEARLERLERHLQIQPPPPAEREVEAETAERVETAPSPVRPEKAAGKPERQALQPPVIQEDAAVEPPPLPTPAPTVPAPPPAAPPTTPPTTPPTVPPVTPSQVGETAKVAELARATRSAKPRAAGAPPAAGYAPIPVEPLAKPPTTRPLEMLIGIKIAAWVGAIVVVVGGGLFIQYGYQEGWWSAISYSARCWLLAGFGALLLIGGELALRKIGKTASAGLYSAGLGVMYLDAYATFHLDLLSKEAAFVLMGIVAVFGFAITLRTKFRAIGILSLVGGYLTPILLHGDSTHDLELLSYLTVLFGIALALSAFRPRDFRSLRYLALGGQVIIGLLWVIPNGADHWMMAVFFMSIWWGMVLAEAVFAAMRRQSMIGNVIATLLTTAAYVTCGCWILDRVAPTTGFDWLGAFTAAIGLLCAAVAAQFGPGLDGLRGPLRNAMDKLAVALWAQFGILITVAIGLQFEDAGQTIGWIALALGSIEIGRRLPSRGVDVFGLIVGALASGYVALLLVMDAVGATGSALFDTLFEIGQIEFNGWSLLALGTIIVTCVAAHRLRGHGDKPWRAMPIVLTAAAALGWLALSLVLCEELTLTGAWLVGGIILLALERIGRRQRYAEIALLVVLATAGKWLLFDVISGRLDPRWTATEMMPVLNWQMGLAIAIAICGWWGIRVLVGRSAAAGSDDRLATLPGAGAQLPGAGAGLGWQAAIIAGVLFLMVGFSFEVERVVEAIAGRGTDVIWSIGHVKQLSLTLLWTFGAAALGLLTLMMKKTDTAGRPRLPVLIAGSAWGLLIAMALKWILVDTLYWTLSDEREAVLALNRLLNLQMLTGLALAAAGALMMVIARPARSVRDERDAYRPPADPWEIVAAWAPTIASLLILWGLTLEIDRGINSLSAGYVDSLAFKPAILRALWWTGMWAVGGMAMVILGRWRRWVTMVAGGWTLIAGAAIAWLGFDTLGWRITEGAVDANVVVNLQFGIGALLMVLLAVAVKLVARKEGGLLGGREKVTAMSLGLIAALGLWLGSFEIDRALIGEAMKVHAGLSVYWSLYAVLLVIVGFARRSAAARYAGLALLGITLVKVLFFDLSAIEHIWRVISFIVSGLLMVGTSVLYAKLSPLLLESLHGPTADNRDAGGGYADTDAQP